MVTHFKVMGVIGGAVLTMVAIGAVLGLKDVPRPAWSNEVIKVATDLKVVNNRLTVDQLNGALRARNYNLEAQDKYQPGEVPDYLLDSLADIESEIEFLKHLLEKLRDD